MPQLRKKSKSITLIMVTAMLAIVLFQFILVAGAIAITRVVPKLKENAYEIFSQSTESRKNYLESEMHNRWSVVNTYLLEFERLFSDQYILSSEKEIADYLSNTSSSLIAMLRNSGASSSFIILNDGNEQTANSCLYIYDSDPSHNNLETNSDLLVLKGPLEVSKKLGIPLHISWNYGLFLDEDTKHIFYDPYNAALKVNSRQHLGLWSVIPSISTPSAKSITYTVPLINDEGVVFGVAGIEISQDYFFKMIPSDNLLDGSFYGYALLQDQGDGKYVPILTQGAKIQSLLPYQKNLTVNLLNEHFGTYSFDTGNTSFGACIKQIAIYNKNTPFSDTHWYIAGLIPQKSLTSSANSFASAVLLALGISFLVGSFLAVFSAFSLTKSTVNLAKRIQNSTPGEKLDLDSTGLTEIDQLSGAIEQLNYDVLNYALKTDKIISMVNLDIGSFEYDYTNKLVKLSPALSQMLNLNTDTNKCVALDVFDALLEQIKKNRLRENVYEYSKSPQKWLKLESITIDNGVFGIAIDVTKDELARRSIIYERDHDYLTGIYNRFAFKKLLYALFEEKAFKYGAFLMGDLDNLKHINDIYGHDLGDIYIKKTASVISEYLSGKSAIYGRMSGDEFYVFIYGDSKKEINKTVYGVHYALNCESIVLPDGGVFKLKMSCGVSWYPNDSDTAETLIRYADYAMYQGKHSIKGGIQEFDPASYSENSYMFTGKEELYSILDEQLCDYVFQPIYDVISNKIYGYEALMRPYGKNINSPDKLIRLASAQGQLHKIEYNTFYMVFALFKKYLPMLSGQKMFINSVPNQILTDKDYLFIEQTYSELLDKVVIEITENEEIDSEIVKRKKALVEKWGAHLAVDDYGSGYANDLSLIKLQPDIVKIGCMIVDGIDVDKNKQAIVRKTVAFAKESGMTVLAEGVETKAQLETIIKMGVTLLQGYYISHPIALPNFDDREISKTIANIKNDSFATQ